MKRYLFIMVLITSMHIGYSQQDSIIIPKESKDSTDEKYDCVYKLAIKAKDKEIDHLWKMNLVDLGLMTPNIGFEKKISNRFSSDSYLNIGVDLWDNYYEVISKWEINQMLKFYYNRNRREKLGRKTNGFSGNYLSVNLSGGEKQDPQPAMHSGTIVETELNYGAGLNYGMQRRIGNIGYFEFFGGINYQYHKIRKYDGSAPLFDFSHPATTELWKFMPVVRIRAGFALDSFSKRKAIRKY